MTRLLHISYHSGCKANIEYVAQTLCYTLETQHASWNYNIGHQRAQAIWEAHKDYYNSFDCIITSDTGPLSRIFLQNNYSGKLIIYICNRFDYADQASNDCNFPDAEYYQLFREAINKPNVKVYGYTPFEHHYASHYKNINWNKDNLLKPIVPPITITGETLFPSNINKGETFFIPPYHNDTIFMNLQHKCQQLGLSVYNGRYHGPQDLAGIKGIIHIPYAWNNLALFENWSLGNIYFIPSKQFLLTMIHQPNFWFQDVYAKDYLHLSEWYLPEHQELFVYFNSWQDLKIKTSMDWSEKKQKIQQFSQAHTQKTLNTWKEVIEHWL